jgi:hypothetical protein
MQQDIESFNASPSSGSNRSGDLTFTVDHRDHEVRLAVVGELDLATHGHSREAPSVPPRSTLRA